MAKKKRLTNEQIICAKNIKMALVNMILDIPDADMWRLFTASINAQVEASVRRAITEAQEQYDKAMAEATTDEQRE
jgi:hypothetical protein